MPKATCSASKEVFHRCGTSTSGDYAPICSLACIERQTTVKKINQMESKVKKVSIIGFGRFGKTLYRLIKDDFSIVIYDKNRPSSKGIGVNKNTLIAKDIKEALDADTVFLAVPIGVMEDFINKNKRKLKDKIIIDLLSVKTYPKKIYKKYLPQSKVLLAHPMFGPDSSKDGFDGLPIVLDQFCLDDENYLYWKKYFFRKNLKIIEMSAIEHDKTVAKSQAMTHIIGRVLGNFGYKESQINTKGDKKMLEIINQTCNDDLDLFYNIQNKNPYTKNSRKSLQKSIDKVFKSIIDHRYKKRIIPIYGIQGGVGSFNDEAIHKYLNENKINNYRIKYLYTTKNVLNKLDENEIDYGLFAVSNSRGGIVEETTEELGKHHFNVVEIINLPIQHYIMALSGIELNKVEKIMAHPQVFKQCEHNLQIKYPNVVLESGKGESIDSAKIADMLSKGKLNKNIASMGSKRLADMYSLNILDSNLQDDPNNTTNFLLARR